MSLPGSSRVFAIVAIAAAGLASLKALDVTDAAIDLVTLAKPALAAGDAAEEEHADPRGPLDILETDDDADIAGEEGEADTEGEARAEEVSCPAPPPPALAERAGLSLSELQVLRSLSQRRRDLDAREETVIEREGLLAAAQTRVEERIEELRGLETQIAVLLGQIEEAEVSQINALVGLYSRMKSDDAARIFTDLDEDVLLAVASRMNDQALAPILADMPGSQAAELTMALARRHQIPDTLEALARRDEDGS